MAVKLKDMTPLFKLNNRTYFYKENQIGSLLYFCKAGLASSRLFQVKGKEMIPLLKDDNVVIIK